MYNELWLSKFVVIKEDKREISSVAKGVWILNGLWESHAGHLNLEKTTASLQLYVSIRFYFPFRGHIMFHICLLFLLLSSSLHPFSLIALSWKGTPRWRLLSVFENWNYMKISVRLWSLGYPHFFPYVLASQTLR